MYLTGIRFQVNTISFKKSTTCVFSEIPAATCKCNINNAESENLVNHKNQYYVIMYYLFFMSSFSFSLSLSLSLSMYFSPSLSIYFSLFLSLSFSFFHPLSSLFLSLSLSLSLTLYLVLSLCLSISVSLSLSLSLSSSISRSQSPPLSFSSLPLPYLTMLSVSHLSISPSLCLCVSSLSPPLSSLSSPHALSSLHYLLAPQFSASSFCYPRRYPSSKTHLVLSTTFSLLSFSSLNLSFSFHFFVHPFHLLPFSSPLYVPLPPPRPF